MNILIFPCNTIEAVVKAKELKLANHKVFGAASVDVEFHSAMTAFDQCIFLPYVTEQGFDTALKTSIDELEIDALWTSIASVDVTFWRFIEESGGKLQVLSAPPKPFNSIVVDVIKTETQARETYANLLFQGLNPGQALPSPVRSNILAATLRVPGQSHFDKLFTLSCIFGSVPRNTDIVEIGVLWGRTAKLFCCLSSFYQGGSVLCIDPWTSSESLMQETSALFDELTRTFNNDDTVSIFLSHLGAEHYAKASYLREFSDTAINLYENCGGQLVTSELGVAPFKGEIGLLHIDGNHKYESVLEDIHNYVPKVVAGGCK